MWPAVAFRLTDEDAGKGFSTASNFMATHDNYELNAHVCWFIC